MEEKCAIGIWRRNSAVISKDWILTKQCATFISRDKRMLTTLGHYGCTLPTNLLVRCVDCFILVCDVWETAELFLSGTFVIICICPKHFSSRAQIWDTAFHAGVHLTESAQTTGKSPIPQIRLVSTQVNRTGFLGFVWSWTKPIDFGVTHILEGKPTFCFVSSLIKIKIGCYKLHLDVWIWILSIIRNIKEYAHTALSNTKNEDSPFDVICF